MKRDKAVDKEECEGVLSLCEAIRTIKTAILKSRYMAARQANLEHLKLTSMSGRMCRPIRVAAQGTRVRLKRFRRSCRWNRLDCCFASNIKNMCQFFEEWAVRSNRQLATGDLANIDLANIENAAIPANRQSVTDDLADAEVWSKLKGHLM